MLLSCLTGLNVFKADFRRDAERSRVSSWDRNNMSSVLEEAMTRFAVMQRQTEERFRVWMEKLTRLDSDDEDETSKRSSDAQEGGGRGRRPQHRGRRPSPPSSFLPSSESADTMAAYMMERENRSLAPTPVNNSPAQNGSLAGADPRFLNA